MPSPLPGMDPCLEGQVWPEFHTKLIDELQVAPAPLILPRYVARIEERVHLEHTPEEPARPRRPDITVPDTGSPRGPSGGGVAVMDEPALVPLAMPEEMRGGERMPTARPLPSGDYFVRVSRVRRRPVAEVWQRGLRPLDRLRPRHGVSPPRG